MVSSALVYYPPDATSRITTITKMAALIQVASHPFFRRKYCTPQADEPRQYEAEDVPSSSYYVLIAIPPPSVVI